LGKDQRERAHLKAAREWLGQDYRIFRITGLPVFLCAVSPRFSARHSATVSNPEQTKSSNPENPVNPVQNYWREASESPSSHRYSVTLVKMWVKIREHRRISNDQRQDAAATLFGIRGMASGRLRQGHFSIQMGKLPREKRGAHPI
jgi:hypothetical protein